MIQNATNTGAAANLYLKYAKMYNEFGAGVYDFIGSYDKDLGENDVTAALEVAQNQNQVVLTQTDATKNKNSAKVAEYTAAIEAIATITNAVATHTNAAAAAATESFSAITTIMNKTAPEKTKILQIK